MWAIIECDSLQISTNPMKLIALSLKPLQLEALVTVCSAFSGSDASKQGFPVVPGQINYTEGNITGLRLNADDWLCIPGVNRRS